MKPIENANSFRRNTLITITALATFIGAGVMVFSPSSGILSKFTTTSKITAQNAAESWVGGVDNPYRTKLSSNYATKLDTITLAILRRGSSMNDEQFKSYLVNLSRGISELGTRSQYMSDMEVQNILGFLVHEIIDTTTALDTNSNSVGAMNELANLISSTQPSVGVQKINSTQIAEQKVMHDQYFSVAGLNQQVRLADRNLYNRITSKENYDLLDYYNNLQIKQLSGFKGMFWCLGYGRSSADQSQECSGYETSIVGNKLSNPEYETRSVIAFLPRSYQFITPRRSFGQDWYVQEYDTATKINPTFDYQTLDTLKKFRVYLPKGTVGFNITSHVPQWSRYAWAVKLGAPPETTKKLSNAEYLANFPDTNFMNNPDTEELRILRGEEVVVSANGGGIFGIGSERLGLYEKTIADADLDKAHDSVKKAWSNRDQYELKEGQWLYVRELEKDPDAYLDGLTLGIYVKKPVLEEEFKTLEVDSKGDPVFKGFTNMKRNNAVVGAPSRSHITDTYFESIVQSTQCTDRMFLWISNPSYNPQLDCQ